MNKENLKKIYIFGTGGLSDVVTNIINNSQEYIISGYIDNIKKNRHNNKKVFTSSKFLSTFDKTNVVIAIGENSIRKKIYERIKKRKFKFPNIISKNSVLASSVKIGKGNIILSNSVLNNCVNIKNFTVINSNSLVEHDSIVDTYSQISPGAVICGNGKIGKGSYIGANSTVIQNIKIGSWSVVGASSLVINNIKSKTLNFGQPTNIIKNIDFNYKVF